jgi:hypothetical protein
MTAPTAGSTPPQRTVAGRYRLERVLGRGAMGAVWHAEDTVLRRPVAVKEVILPHGLSPSERAVACERTLREARSIARLAHPNVVTLFDVLDEDGRPWVVMELVPARSLAQVVREEGTLDPVRTAMVGIAVLSALEAAHAAGITHRDVKPGNILIADDGRTKLTDFGIARSVEDSALTSTGFLLGSPSYIAPEVVRGSPAGPPADMFGLGATLYAAVEGRPPFRGEDPIATLNAVASAPPEPFRLAGPLVPTLDGLLRKDPTARLTASAAHRMLQDVVRDTDNGVYVPPGPQPGWAPAGPPTGGYPVPGPPSGQVPGPPSGPSGPPSGSPMGMPAQHGPPVRVGVVTPPGTQVGYAGPGGPPTFGGYHPVGYPPPRRRAGRTWVVLALVGAVCLALLLAGVFLMKNVLGSSTANPGASRTPTSTGQGSGTAAPEQIPDGYTPYTGPDGDYTVGIPQDWVPKRTSAKVTEVRNPDDNDQFIRLIASDHGSDALAELTSEEPGFRRRYPSYSKINLGTVGFRGYNAADWEFTFDKDGATKHVLYRLFVADGRYYGLYLSAPEDAFSGLRKHFDTAAATFAVKT